MGKAGREVGGRNGTGRDAKWGRSRQGSYRKGKGSRKEGEWEVDMETVYILYCTVTKCFDISSYIC